MVVNIYFMVVIDLTYYYSSDTGLVVLSWIIQFISQQSSLGLLSYCVDLIHPLVD